MLAARSGAARVWARAAWICEAQRSKRMNEDRVRSSMRDLTLARVEAEQAVGGVRQAAADQIEETRSLRVLLKDVIARVGSNTAARNAGR
ncbi:hypothetical protein ASE63_08000 [Bosea sp. Root381]|uniref:hypothetical protein n=1 Tax=Bosea sp. Root381 TaxID=1736524 RepID=UPI0006FFA819|nr:hypothetical protein [Bosea sp. Root381]KRE02292.1 hypothetical protein ASE63_08000 [Bosea sp. Root381]